MNLALVTVDAGTGVVKGQSGAWCRKDVGTVCVVFFCSGYVASRREKTVKFNML